MSRDTSNLHKADLVALVLLEYSKGLTQDELRRKHHTSPKFIQNVLEDKAEVCAYCKRLFFPQKDGQKFGSNKCYFSAVKELGTA